MVVTTRKTDELFDILYKMTEKVLKEEDKELLDLIKQGVKVQRNEVYRRAYRRGYRDGLKDR